MSARYIQSCEAGRENLTLSSLARMAEVLNAAVHVFFHAPSTTAEENEPTRPRRQRPPRVMIAEEPLQMVETTPKDSSPAG